MINLISYHVGGLGGLSKKNEIHKLIQTQKPKVLRIQETKMENVERNLCSWLWGTLENDFHHKPFDGRSEGIVTIWDSKEFCVKRRVVKDHFIFLTREWGNLKTLVNIIKFTLCAKQLERGCCSRN